MQDSVCVCLSSWTNSLSCWCCNFSLNKVGRGAVLYCAAAEIGQRIILARHKLKEVRGRGGPMRLRSIAVHTNICKHIYTVKVIFIQK